ncbi:MAG: ferrochelatase [Nitrospirales bacterium]|nr:ferrochelatase [Nitrospirales bacterium]
MSDPISQPEPIGVLLMALGGPDSLESVEPFLKDVRGGRPTPPELIHEITERYRVTGGKSPVLAIMTDLVARLEARLNAAGPPCFRVYVGFRHWHPYIRETYQEIVKAGVRRLVGLCMAPQNSQLSVGAYVRKVEEAQAESGASIRFTYVPSWNTHPSLIQGIVANIREALGKFPADARDRVAIIFTAHSLPERILKDGDSYPGQVRETVEAVRSALGPLPPAGTWRFAYQSQGRTGDTWLGPTVEETLDELHGAGFRHVLVAPIGFVSDHLEVLYDIDIDFRKRASDKGMQLERIAMLNATAPFVETLRDIVTAHLTETGR